jgi:hypothetical protein
MASLPQVRCLLWDFGNTICDELSLWRSSREWMDVYDSFDEDGGIGSAWSRGQLDIAEVAARLAKRMTLNEAQIRSHLSRTDLFEFFPFTYAFLRAQHLPQAIVTVNPSVFREMAQKLGLHEVTDTIVVSGEEKITDKGRLCEIAVQRMPFTCANEQALLIDDKQSNLDAWTARGGPGYLYTTDAAFRQDVAGGIGGLVRHWPSR